MAFDISCIIILISIQLILWPSIWDSLLGKWCEALQLCSSLKVEGRLNLLSSNLFFSGLPLACLSAPFVSKPVSFACLPLPLLLRPLMPCILWHLLSHRAAHSPAWQPSCYSWLWTGNNERRLITRICLNGVACHCWWYVRGWLRDGLVAVSSCAACLWPRHFCMVWQCGLQPGSWSWPLPQTWTMAWRGLQAVEALAWPPSPLPVVAWQQHAHMPVYTPFHAASPHAWNRDSAQATCDHIVSFFSLYTLK